MELDEFVSRLAANEKSVQVLSDSKYFIISRKYLDILEKFLRTKSLKFSENSFFTKPINHDIIKNNPEQIFEYKPDSSELNAFI